MRSALAWLSAALVLTGCATTPEVDPVQLRLDDIDARVGRIDRIVSNQSLIQMAQQLDALQSEIRSLRGRIEELQNENVKLRKEQRDLYADLDKRADGRRCRSGGGQRPAARGCPVASLPAPPRAMNSRSIRRALEEIRARNYAAAVEILRNLASTYPEWRAGRQHAVLAG